jgi:hypothetical protein
MKALFLVIPFVCIFGCTNNKQESRPEPAAQALPPPVFEEPALEEPAFEAPVAAVQEVEAEETGFDPQDITAEEKETTMDEIRLLVAEINRVIRARDYEGWVSHLADDFIAAINSPGYLAQLSKTSRQLKAQNIVLRTPRDYFIYVVVASRENVRVDASLDDIEFLNHNQVKAFTIDIRKQRLRLFEFVKAGNTWKIAFTS